MASYGVSKIVVWERANKLGKWCPYSAHICQFLEEHHMTDSKTVRLGDVDEELRIYTINFKDMVQVSDVTGTKSPIRRQLCDSLCVLGRGFSWQWHDENNTWNSYDVDINNFIDFAFLEGKQSISLNRKFPGYHYEIIFSKMIQINKRSKRKRKIRRVENTSSYPVTPCVEETKDLHKKNLDYVSGIQEILSPEFLGREIPGTRALENQVNAYKRNVEGSENIKSSVNDSHFENTDAHSCPKHAKFSSIEEQGCISQLEQSSSTCPTTVALVKGKEWSDRRPPHTPQSKLKPVPGIDPLPILMKPKKSKKKGAVISCPDEETSVLEKFTDLVVLSPETENEACMICFDSLSAASSYDGDSALSKLTLCSHIFHKSCIEAMYNSCNKEFLQCPYCKTLHGEKCGIQPPGEMIYHVLPYSLPGYSENDTIRIIYDIKPGIQGPEHPNPGERYSARGFPRHCYLPDNEIGRKILRLLVKAWKRRLIFTIGQSVTTGEENTVTWNEIHHKTEFGCNRYGHGYPDPNYFSNVLAELEAHGIVADAEEVSKVDNKSCHVQ